MVYGNMSVTATPDFFRRAAEMRSEFDAIVGPQRSASPRRFRWDYWYVPGQFAYIRTLARNCFSSELYSEFATTLRGWAQEKLGCYVWTDPWLSYYIAGCRQEFHSDVLHGPWAWVYSLTDWERRGFSGGETALLRSGTLNYWRNFDPGHPQEADQIIHRIPARFNQLVVFDGRIPHAVVPVEGTMDPLDSRVVLHGWFLQPEARAEGSLAFNDIRLVLTSIKEKWQSGRAAYGRLSGLITLRLQVESNGSVRDVELVASTLVSLDCDDQGARQALDFGLELANSSRYRASPGTTTITLPLIAEDH
jgi:hypothetical protein